MFPRRRGCLRVVSAVTLPVAALLSASTAFAHIDLLEPEARAHGTAARGDTQIDANSNVKSGPCGQMTAGRTARVATYAPGETLTVRVREENAHVSYLRVRLNLDGESFPVRAQVPAMPETQEQAMAAEIALGEQGLLAVVRENNDTAGFVHELEITLPEATCENCTLQVIQFMYDDPTAPYYFQCADLVIAEPGAAQDAGAAAPNNGGGTIGSVNPEQAGSPNSAAGSGGSSSSAAAPGAGGASAAAGPGAASGSASPLAAASSTSPNDVASSTAGGDSEGCSLARRTLAAPSSVYALLALGLVSARRRRSRRGLQ